MRASRIGQPRRRWIWATAGLLITTALLAVGGSSFAGDSSGSGSKWRHRRDEQQKQFLRDHSDASGKPRPDLWWEGVEQQKKLQVAPYIGWHPKTADRGKSGSTGKQQ